MAREWRLVHTFNLPVDSEGRQLKTVRSSPDYFNKIFKLRFEYKDCMQEIRGGVHEKLEFWVY